VGNRAGEFPSGSGQRSPVRLNPRASSRSLIALDWLQLSYTSMAAGISYSLCPRLEYITRHVYRVGAHPGEIDCGKITRGERGFVLQLFGGPRWTQDRRVNSVRQELFSTFLVFHATFCTSAKRISDFVCRQYSLANSNGAIRKRSPRRTTSPLMQTMQDASGAAVSTDRVTDTHELLMRECPQRQGPPPKNCGAARHLPVRNALRSQFKAVRVSDSGVNRFGC
jgi:hypothetical protein